MCSSEHVFIGAQNLAQRVNLSNDHFIRTTDPAHKEAVQYAWHLLEERGYIHQSKHEGWYSISDETFYPESAVHLILDPPTGRKMMVSMETGKEVQWTSEQNYHFRLSAFRDQLLAFYKDNPTWITPSSRMKEVVGSVEAGLEDLSISRPLDRLSWGIRVPTDDTQTIYVWLDALLSYATKAGYPWAPGSEHAGGWPADVQVIGKDIVRFHCVYWPAFLMALDLPLPQRIMTHAHWTLGKQKMAKSTGNVVNPFFALDRFGTDAMRFFLMHNGGLVDDADYDNRYIIERYTTDLKNGLGNLLSRVMRGKGWDVRQAILRYETPGLLDSDCERFTASKVGTTSDKSKIDPAVEMSEYRRYVENIAGTTQACMDEMKPDVALKRMTTSIYAANAFVQAQEPWFLAKALRLKENEVMERRLQCIIYLAAEHLRILGILLQPYIPEKAGELLDMLGVAEDRRLFVDAVVGADFTYGEAKKEDPLQGLFPPLTSLT